MATHSLSHFRLKLVQAILFFASNCRFQTQLVPKSFKNSNSSASLAQSKLHELRQRARAACFEQQADVFACCGALRNQSGFPLSSAKMPVSLDKSVKLNCAFQSGNPPFLRTRRLKFSVDPPSTGDAGSIYEPCRLRLNAAASSPQWLVSRWSPPTRNVRVTNHLCPHSRKVVYSHQAMATRKNKMFEEHLSLFIRAPAAAAQDVATEWSNPEI